LKKIYLFRYNTFIYFLDAYTHVDETIITTPTKSRHYREQHFSNRSGTVAYVEANVATNERRNVIRGTFVGTGDEFVAVSLGIAVNNHTAATQQHCPVV